MEAIVPGTFSLLIQAPLFLVLFAGVLLCLIYWRRHPTVSALALVGLVLLIARGLVGIAVTFWTPAVASGMGIRSLGIVFSVNQIIQALLGALAFGLLVAAIFTQRKARD